ncbi:4-hydroxy-tetrahydrodipicolinate synthase [Limihaloglobus sulfuriphilus]|uniref:4-hydroxy-tetrahydrodipicolinate synthase n=1 Tax=Limihaloglobus sulfuriphilus TaxID=1851148 RepID=A0A1Q2MAU9_9BACT|nr:dihydrodipicolinate synthase family protein [Limihaloglobus sulfuriphilus]AQQ69853.1 4-hydroxy-tetrahydrodipicolinate synthase [Limihaloglobus sulfuriphilus]
MKKQFSKDVCSVMLTSFNDDKSIDLNGLRSLIDFYIDNGCNALFAACSSSEVLYLTRDEIVTLCRETVDYTAGRAEVFGGAICQSSLAEQAELIKMIKDAGIEVPVITTNQLCKEDDPSDVWKDNLLRLLEMTDGPLGMYESPFPFVRLLSTDEMQLVVDSGRFAFFKDTCCNIDGLKEKIQIKDGSSMAFYNANVDTLVGSLDEGADGYCGTAANFYPEVIRLICDNHADHDLIKPAFDFIRKGEDAFKNTYPLAAKYFLQKRGVDMKLNCRTEVKTLASKDEQMLSTLLSDMHDVLKIYEQKSCTSEK